MSQLRSSIGTMLRHLQHYRPCAVSTGLTLLLCLVCGAARADENPPVPEDEDIDIDGTSNRVNADLDPVDIEASGAIIGKIMIRNRNIFDLDNPLDNKSLFRLANRLHITTKPQVIESQLLFEEGDIYTVRLTDETERLLRHHAYLREAEVRPVNYANGIVDLEVETIDVWTLTPDISLGRNGGENHFRAGILEQNLLGSGIQLGGQYESTVDRDTLSFLYADNNFLNDRFRLAANIGDSNDGYFRVFEFGKPFYALDSRRAGRLFYVEGKQVDQLYDRGNVVTEFGHRFDYHEVSLGRSRGLRSGWTRRYSAGVVYTRDKFDRVSDDMLPVTILPEDREYLYPFVNFELVQDRFETTVNFDQIERTEDRFVGTWLNARLGYSSKSAGSVNNAWHYTADVSNALITTNKTSITIASHLGGRWENGHAQNALLSGMIRLHQRTSEQQLFYVGLSVAAGKNLDIDRPLYLGGETGLRGYPLRYQNGESKALLTLEQRIFTDWYPFRLFHVGGAVFFDAGKVWGDSAVGAPKLGILKDVGFGVRLGTSRSSSGSVLHIDFAFPLDGEDDIDNFQILINYKESF